MAARLATIGEMRRLRPLCLCLALASAGAGPLPEAGVLGSPAELALDPPPRLHHPDAVAAARALEAGEAARALGLARRARILGPLDVEERAAVAWIEAVALERRGLPHDAFAAYGRLFAGEAPPGLAAHAAFHHARLGLALDARGAFPEGLPGTVETALAAVPLDSRFGPEAYLQRANRLLAEGDTDVACALADAAAEQTEGLRAEAGARLALARCIEARAREAARSGERQTARAGLAEAASAYRTVAGLWPDQAAGERAAAQLSRLEAAGVRPAALDGDAHLARARRIHARRFGAVATPALNRARRVLPAGHPARHEIDLMRASLAEDRRHFRAAARLYHQVRRGGATPEQRARGALGIEGLRARRAPSAAVDRYLAVAEAYPRTEAAADARLRAAEIAWRLGRTAPARDGFEACLKAHPEAPAAARCAFGLGWARWHEGDLEGAKALIAPVADRDVQTRYWYGRLLEEAGDHEAAFAIWRGIVAEQPFAYYAVMAGARMAVLGAAIADDAPPTAHAGAPPAGNADVLAAETLLGMGLKTDARALLVGLERGRLDIADRARAARLWMSLGEMSRAMRMAVPAWDGGLEAPPTGDALLSAVLAYPRAYGHAVESPNRDTAVPATLLYALIRAESAFDPEARSHAGALGLTQVIPPTARATAERIGLDPFRFRMLTEPEISVRVGSAYLGWLLERFEGNVPLAVAAYNAGEDAVDRWLARRGHLPVDAFIEEIPFHETNRYTRRVLSFWAIYRVLYEGETAVPLPIDFELPASRPPAIAQAALP
jgi:soluble lytic murein transglycosylase